jgi:hypothetical protein
MCLAGGALRRRHHPGDTAALLSPGSRTPSVPIAPSSAARSRATTDQALLARSVGLSQLRGYDNVVLNPGDARSRRGSAPSCVLLREGVHVAV